MDATPEDSSSEAPVPPRHVALRIALGVLLLLIPLGWVAVAPPSAALGWLGLGIWAAAAVTFTVTQVSHLPRKRRAGITAGIASGAALLTLVFTYGQLYLASPAAFVSKAIVGTARCDSGASVSGVYILTDDGGTSDFAAWKPDTLDPSRASFSRSLGVRGQYSIQVGCGVDPDGEWATNLRSETSVTGPSHDLVCHDRVAIEKSTKFGLCTVN